MRSIARCLPTTVCEIPIRCLLPYSRSYWRANSDCEYPHGLDRWLSYHLVRPSWYGRVVPSSIVYSHTCHATAPTNKSTVSSSKCDHTYYKNATLHMQTRTCGLTLPTHAPPCYVSNEMHHIIECKRTTRTHLLHHVQNDFDQDIPKAR